MCATALLSAGRAPAATVGNNTTADFLTGLTTGGGSAMTAGRSGGVGAAGVALQPGASVVSDDFNYANTAAATAAGWQFLLPNGPDPALSSFSFPGNGALRFHVWKQQDFWNTGLAGQDQPVLAVNNKALTGDFVAETKLTVQTPRANNNRIQGGLVVLLPDPGSVEANAPTVTIDGNQQYYGAVAQNADDLLTFARWYPQDYPWPVALDTFSYPGDTVTVRIVRSGPVFHSFFRTSDNGPWIESGSFSIGPLKSDPNQPVLIGLIAKGWGGPDDYQDTDFDYFKINQLAADQTSTYSNVLDGGIASNWQSLSLITQNMTGVKFQVRAGNARAAGTLTDAGDFVGPDNTAATYYEGDIANILPPAAQNKRYLEYKLFMNPVNATPDHAAVANLPTVVMNVNARYQPAPIAASIKTNKADFGADTGNVAVQNGDGDLGLKRTVVYRQDFNDNAVTPGDMSNTSDNSDWVFDAGTHNLDPSVFGNYSWNGDTGQASQVSAGTPATPGPAGWLRIETGYMQDIWGGAKGGGVRMFKRLNGLTDFEVETELKVETQNNRMAGLYVWMNDANFIGISASRRFADTTKIGLEDDNTINNTFPTPDMIYTDYGTNHVFLRITKQGQILTLSYRDADSPTWRVHRVFDLTGAASGGSDFTPVYAGLMTKSFDHADRDTKFADYNYFQISSVATSGTKDLNFALPAGSTPDTLVAMADAPGSLSYQVKDSGGNFVGPDGTAGSTFSPDEPKLPASASGTNATVRATFSGTNPAGSPFLHAIGVQYSTGPIVRDTNRADFDAGLVKTSVNLTDRPGAVTGVAAPGTPVQEDFTAAPTDWLWSNNPPGNSNYAFTGGNAELQVATPSDTWGGGDAPSKPRVFLYKATPVTGNFILETHVNFPNGRTTNRHQGLGVIQARNGAAPDLNLDVTNVINYGPYTNGGVNSMAILHGDNNIFGDGPHADGYNDNSYYLRLTKVGNVFTGYVSTDGVNWTQTNEFDFSHDMGTMYVGFFSKSWPGSSGTEVVDFDYFKFTPIIVNGNFESRHLDLGPNAAGLTPVVTSDGNTANVQLQFRAADTEAGLASATYVGPDGTSATSYSGTYAGPLVGMAGKRWFQYKAVLQTGALLNDVAIAGAASTGPATGDAKSALKIAGGLQTATAQDKTKLDVNGDGKVDLSDAAKLLRTLNGL